jgi:hypothetical protein
VTVAAPALPRPSLTFEEDAHLYRVDGRVVPSVTQIIREVFPEAWPWSDEFAMRRGAMVHKALHFWILGELDPKSVSSYIAGYVAAGVRFLSESGFEIARTPDGALATEVRMYSPTYDFAGTADLFGTLTRRFACVDHKSGEPGWPAGPQTWAYSQLWQEMTGTFPRDRFALRLFDDGSYQLVPYKSTRDDQADFLAALRVWNRRRLLAS